METKLVLLKLVLDELGIPADISTFSDRKRVQKAIYLGQRAGHDLGYRFAWYIKGPYSTDLTRDYYSMSDAIAAGDESYKDKKLVSSVVKRFDKSKPLLKRPEENVRLSEEDWLELVASVDYLSHVSKFDKKQCRATIASKKPSLASCFDQAYKTLASAKLVRT